MVKSTIMFASAVSFSLALFAQAKPEDTQVFEPVPKVVTPGATSNDAPADAIILFDGKNLNEWASSKDPTKNAEWTLSNKVITVNKAVGDIQTKRSFTDFQLHIEYQIPSNITGSGQARGNSGVFLAAPAGQGGYELQVLDSYNNSTYVNGQAGSIYKQSPPLVNASRKPGEWQTYDVVWTAPRFNDDGSVKSPARVTVSHNGVLVQNNFELKGHTPNVGKPAYAKHGASPIRLQSHGDKSEPISYRNIWLRQL
jgi:hypothetical protein